MAKLEIKIKANENFRDRKAAKVQVIGKDGNPKYNNDGTPTMDFPTYQGHQAILCLGRSALPLSERRIEMFAQAGAKAAIVETMVKALAKAEALTARANPNLTTSTAPGADVLETIEFDLS